MNADESRDLAAPGEIPNEGFPGVASPAVESQVEDRLGISCFTNIVIHCSTVPAGNEEKVRSLRDLS